MKTFHITYYLQRGDDQNTSPLLGGFTIQAENVIVAILEYRMRQNQGDDLPPVTEIKYIIEL